MDQITIKMDNIKEKEDFELDKRINRMREMKRIEDNEKKIQKERLEKNIKSEKNLRAVHLNNLYKDGKYTFDYKGNVLLINNKVKKNYPSIISSCNFGLKIVQSKINTKIPVESKIVKRDSCISVKNLNIYNEYKKLDNISTSNFDIISPSLGVTITENGRTKSNNSTSLFSQIPKTEFLSTAKLWHTNLFNENTQKNEINLKNSADDLRPSFIPLNTLRIHPLQTGKQRLTNTISQGFISYASENIKNIFNKIDENVIKNVESETSYIPFHYPTKIFNCTKKFETSKIKDMTESKFHQNQNGQFSSKISSILGIEYNNYQSSFKKSYVTPKPLKKKRIDYLSYSKNRFNPIERRTLLLQKRDLKHI